MKIEHDIWLRDSRLPDGYEWAAENNDALRLHRDIAPFDQVPLEDQQLDGVIVDSIIPTLQKHGFKLVKTP
jgi:hypothetical protein